VLAYLSRYTHRVAISNHRLVAFDKTGVTFRYKDYRRDGADRQRTMTLSPDEFIRRFLLHVLPKGFHRIRHYGLLASTGRKANLARARKLLLTPEPAEIRELAPPSDLRPRAPAAAVAWSSSRFFSLPLKRARRLHRLPLPACRCRDSSQRIASYRRSCGASAIGWSRTRVGHQLLHCADDDQLSRPAVVASRQSRALRPTAPRGAATQRHFAVAGTTARAYRNL
jgi:hypothetical protein